MYRLLVDVIERQAWSVQDRVLVSSLATNEQIIEFAVKSDRILSIDCRCWRKVASLVSFSTLK